MAQSWKKEREKRWKARILTMEPTQRWQITTVEKTERNKYKIPILSDRETDLSKINPRMWCKQISGYIDLYQKKLEELIEQGTVSTQLLTSKATSYGHWALKRNTTL